MLINKNVLTPEIVSQDFSCQTFFDKAANKRVVLKKSNSYQRMLQSTKYNVRQSIGKSDLKYDNNSNNHCDKPKKNVSILTQLEEKLLDSFLNTNIAVPKAKPNYQAQSQTKFKTSKGKEKGKNKNIKLPFIEEPKHYTQLHIKKLSKENSQSMTSLTNTHKGINDKSKPNNINIECYNKNKAFLIQNKYNNSNSTHNKNHTHLYNKHNQLKDHYKKGNVTYRGFSLHNDVVKETIAKGLFQSSKDTQAKSPNHNAYYTNLAQLLYI